MKTIKPKRTETGTVEINNPDTGKREHWDTFEARLQNGRVQINLIAYPDELVAGTMADGLRLHAEQMAAIRVFADLVPADQLPDDHAREAADILRTMREDGSGESQARLRRWYERDIALGAQHRYPQPSPKGQQP